MATTSTRIRVSARSTCCRSSSESSSAQCRSSSTSSTGAAAPAASQQRRGRLQRAQPLHLGGRGRGLADAREARSQRWEHRQQIAGPRAELHAQLVERARRRIGRERFGERLRGRGRPVVAVPVQHHAALPLRVRRQLGRQPRLADPRLTGHEHPAAAAVRRVAPGPAQSGERRLAPGEHGGAVDGERGSERDRHGTAGGPAHPPGVHRVRQARQRQLARVFQCLPRRGPGQQAHGIRDKDLPRAGGGADPLSLDDRRSEDVVGLPGHVSRADAHAHRERDRAAVRLPVDRPLNVRGAGDRGPGRLENGQEAVAERLDLLTAVHGDHIPQPAIVLAAYGVGVLVAQLASHPRGAGEIGEQDGGRRATALRRRRLHGGRRTVPQLRIVGQDRPLEPLELGRRGAGRARRRASAPPAGRHRARRPAALPDRGRASAARAGAPAAGAAPPGPRARAPARRDVRPGDPPRCDPRAPRRAAPPASRSRPARTARTRARRAAGRATPQARRAGDPRRARATPRRAPAGPRRTTPRSAPGPVPRARRSSR